MTSEIKAIRERCKAWQTRHNHATLMDILNGATVDIPALLAELDEKDKEIERLRAVSLCSYCKRKVLELAPKETPSTGDCNVIAAAMAKERQHKMEGKM